MEKDLAPGEERVTDRHAAAKEEHDLPNMLRKTARRLILAHWFDGEARRRSLAPSSVPDSPSPQAGQVFCQVAVGMSNKRRGHAGDGGEKRSRRLKHLYLVLDDWTKGYSIHKIQADSFDSNSDSDDQHSSAARHLPEPPTLRLIYDTKTAAMTIGAHAPADMVCGFGIIVVVGEMLYALSYHFRMKQHSFGVIVMGVHRPGCAATSNRGLVLEDSAATTANVEGDTQPILIGVQGHGFTFHSSPFLLAFFFLLTLLAFLFLLAALQCARAPPPSTFVSCLDSGRCITLNGPEHRGASLLSHQHQ
ncbi:hypothetical protein TRIUR3_26911 [Triticum urartu]|uniref:Uncharacterized protein n=1 Tax=Triticum urartu TaxID=4572 RepID=M7YEU5_TRIUA|nr:hypothetical protein TRIUR3_26911 [Triticum urartu]